MSEPDFDQIAQCLADYLVDSEDIQFVTEQLRLVWNARGAADIATIDRVEAIRPNPRCDAKMHRWAKTPVPQLLDSVADEAVCQCGRFHFAQRANLPGVGTFVPDERADHVRLLHRELRQLDR